MNNKQFLEAVAEDYYYIWSGNVPYSRIPEAEYSEEIERLLKKTQTMIANNEDWRDVESTIIDIFEDGSKSGFAAGFAYALALCGNDSPENETETQPVPQQISDNSKDEITEAQVALMFFDSWQDALIEGAVPHCGRFESEFMELYKEHHIREKSPLYYMFMGFVGGLDYTDKLIDELDYVKDTDELNEAGKGNGNGEH